MLSTDEFVAWAKSYVLYLHVETERGSSAAARYGGSSYPYVAFLDAEGTLIAKHRDVRALPGFQAAALRANVFVEARRRAEGGRDRAAKVDFAIAKLDLEVDRYTLEKAQGYVRDLGEVSDTQERAIEGLLASLEVREIFEKVRGNDQAEAEAARKCFDMRGAGRIPVEFRSRLDFWRLVSIHAERMRDAVVYEEALNALKAVCAGDADLISWLKDGFEPRLAALKGK